MVVTQGQEQSELRAGTYLKAAGEKLCSCTRGYDHNAQTQQEVVTRGFLPLSASQEKGERQKTGGVCHRQTPWAIRGE